MFKVILDRNESRNKRDIIVHGKLQGSDKVIHVVKPLVLIDKQFSIIEIGLYICQRPDTSDLERALMLNQGRFAVEHINRFSTRSTMEEALNKFIEIALNVLIEGA